MPACMCTCACIVCMSICCVHVLLRMRILVCICMCVYLRLGIYIIGEKGCSCFREWERRQGHRSHARVQVKRDCVGDSSSMGEGRDWGGDGGGERERKLCEGSACTYQRQTEADRNRHMARCSVAEGNSEGNSVSNTGTGTDTNTVTHKDTDTDTDTTAQTQTQTQIGSDRQRSPQFVLL